MTLVLSLFFLILLGVLVKLLVSFCWRTVKGQNGKLNVDTIITRIIMTIPDTNIISPMTYEIWYIVY